MSGTPERTRYCSRCLTTFPADAPKCPNLGCRSARPAIGWGELLEAGEVIDRTYRIHARLAIGGAGVTYLGGELGADGVSEVGPRVAIKVLYQQRDQGSYLRRLSTEAQILQGLNHPQIVECRGFVHRAGHSPYLVTRYEEGGSLLDHIRRVGTLSIPVVAALGRQVCWALDVAHRQGVVHRDLKPENVLLVREVPVDQVPSLRVADFGIAKVYGGVGDRLTRVGAFVGTPQYAAPEQFDGLAPEPATDVYAVGALLYFCIAARPVADFMAELDPDSQRDHLVRHLPPRLDPEHGTPEMRRWMEDTLAIAMAVDPGDRCDIAQLEARLAAIQERRDPGFVRLPPAGSVVPGSRTIQATEPASTADTLDTGHVRPLVTGDIVGAADPGLGVPPPVPPPVPASMSGRTAPWLSAGGGVSANGVSANGVSATGGGSPSLAKGPPPVPVPAPPVSEAEGRKNQGPPPVPPVSPRADPTSGRPADISGSQPPPIPRNAGGLDPVRTAPVRTLSNPPRPAAARTGVASLGCGLVTVGVGAVGLVVAAVLGWMWFSGPRVLTGTETDPDLLRDWQLVASALGERGYAAEVLCKSPPYLTIEVVVEGSGALTETRLLDYPDEATRVCVDTELKKTPFPRNGTGLVQVKVKLQK